MQWLCCLSNVGHAAVSRTVLQGRFTIAAKHHMTIAEIYETDMVDIEKVMCPSVHEYVSHSTALISKLKLLLYAHVFYSY